MTTNLVLDARQRAMLAEMGVRVWLPSEVKVAVPAQVIPLEAKLDMPSQPVLAQAVPVRREPPLRLPVLSSPPVLNSAPVRYVISNMPAEAASFDCILLGEPCTGDAEKLLANMAKALGGKLFIAQMVAAQGDAQNDAQSLAEQLSNVPAKVIVALGPHAAKALLGEIAQTVPFAKLRGTSHSVQALAAKAVVTYHPMQILKKAAIKAQTWLDLKLVLKELK
jgi:uracil-DNA glycosylase family 4